MPSPPLVKLRTAIDFELTLSKSGWKCRLCKCRMLSWNRSVNNISHQICPEWSSKQDWLIRYRRLCYTQHGVSSISYLVGLLVKLRLLLHQSQPISASSSRTSQSIREFTCWHRCGSLSLVSAPAVTADLTRDQESVCFPFDCLLGPDHLRVRTLPETYHKIRLCSLSITSETVCVREI